MDDSVAEQLLLAIRSDRLALVVGAGLSMALPSRVPSAADVTAQVCKDYRLSTGGVIPPVSAIGLEALANFFISGLGLPEFVRLVNWREFRRNPNLGHLAVADLLGCKALGLVVTTNFDELVELAARDLGEDDPRCSLTPDEASETCPHATFVKLHGCCVRQRSETLWSSTQLTREPWSHRIPEFADYLATVLRGKDIVFIGLSSDWTYLTNALARSMSKSSVKKVVFVDPLPADELERKAPELWTWVRAQQFIHVRESGADFLDDLRRRFGAQFRDQLLEKGRVIATTHFGTRASAPPPTEASALDLFELRRDACGVPPGQMPRLRAPTEEMALVGASHLLLIEKGASVDGSAYVLGDDRIRVIQGSGQSLDQVMARYTGLAVPFPPEAKTVVVCAGARDLRVPHNIVRGDAVSNIVRPSPQGRWVTEEYLKSLAA